MTTIDLNNITSPASSTAWGTPVVCKNVLTNTFEIIYFGNAQRKIAAGFATIDAVGAWVRAHGGEMGAIKEHFFLGRYREIYLPYPAPMCGPFRLY